MFPKLQTVITLIQGRQMPLSICIMGMICGWLFANGNGYRCIRGVFLLSSPQLPLSKRRKMSMVLCSKDSAETPKGAGITSLNSSEFHLVKMLDLIFFFFLYESRHGCRFSSHKFISLSAVTVCSLLSPMGAGSPRLGVWHGDLVWTSSVADSSLLRS